MNAQLGIVFQYRAKFYRLVDIEIGSDGSLYFLPRHHDSEVGRRLKIDQDKDGQIILNVNEVEHGCFPTKKFSRHPSGYIHIKDVEGKGGRREKDGLKGVAFKDVGFHVVITICPQTINTLVEIDLPSATDVQIHLSDVIDPFNVQVAVWDGKTPIPKFVPGEFMGDRAITCRVDGQDFGLVFMFPFVKKTHAGPIHFPVRTCCIMQ